MKKVALFYVLCSVSLSLYAQFDKNNTKWMEYIEEMAGNGADENSLENLFTDLSYLSEHPFNLSQVSKTDLEKFPFLSDKQIENILYYTYRYTPLTSIYELKNVEGLDRETIEYLLPFVYVSINEEKTESLDARRIFRYARQELLWRYDHCLQEKSGYRKVSDEEKMAHPNRYYVGEPYYTSLKYGFQYKDRVLCGIVAEKDAGEALWNAQHKGFDYFSAHLAIKNVGVLKFLLIGDYRLAFGQGLILNTDFSLTNTSDVLNINRKTEGIKRHYSGNETSYFRGIASTFGIKRTSVTLFYSDRKIDASADDLEITSIKTDGYRRTQGDLLKKDEASTRAMGGNINWKNDFLSLGFTVLYHDFGGKKLNPDMKPYNIHYLRDSYNYNTGVNYLWRRKKFLFTGESAMSKNKALACLNTIQVYPTSFFNFVISQRYFAPDYQAFYASVSGSSSVQNESGWYLGAVLQPVSKWKLSASFDIVRYPWLKYLIDSPSQNISALLNVNYAPSRNCEMNITYKYREKMKNVSFPSQATKMLLPDEQHYLKYQLNVKNYSGFYTKTQLFGNFYQSSAGLSKGYMAAQNIGWNPQKLPVQGDFYMAYFLTDDWDSRIYAYEKSILYAFNAPAFSGKGLRTCFTGKWEITSFLSLDVKLAWTRYFDREIIGSGLEMIEGRDKIDLYGLIKYKF